MENFDVIICGAGPAGKAAAIKLSSCGKKVLCIEPNELGGTCLNRGCIPTKSFIASADSYIAAKEAHNFGINADNISFDWNKILERNAQIIMKLRKGIEFLFKKYGVKTLKAKAKILESGRVEAKFDDGHSEIFEAGKIVAACGTNPRRLPFLPQSERILDSSAALALCECPKSVIIIGAGAIGVEFAHIWNAFGAKVDLIEMMPDILPLEDPEGSRILSRAFKKRGINISTSAKLLGADSNDGKISAKIKIGETEKNLEADYMLVCAGVVPDVKSLFSEYANPEIDGRGFLKVDSNFETSIDGVYAAGDIIGAPLLAHTAEYEGILAAEAVLKDDSAKTQKRQPEKIFPACTYCRPQVASVGLDEKSAREKYGELASSTKAFFLANGKAVASGSTDGFAKLVWLRSEEGQKLVGAQIVGENASDIISECVLAINLSATKKQIASSIHPHPTLSEIISAACM